MELKKIFSKRIASQLIAKGNDLLRTEPNVKKKGFVVFVFQDTDKLRKDLTEITRK